MIVMEREPELSIRSGNKIELRVVRSDISFHDLAGDRLRIQVTVRNVGADRSPPTPMRLESAPLGAFVPWQPLTRLLVAPLEPGESRELSTEVARPHPRPLGDFGSVPPRNLLTAVSSPDQPAPRTGSGIVAMLKLLDRGRTDGAGKRDSTGGAGLAPDLWDLLGRSQPHWAGNINVFVGSHPVERHLARALRVYPGRTNLAMFLVGGPGRLDSYAFELRGLAPDWNAALHDATNSRVLRAARANAPLEETRWVRSGGGLVVMLAVHPPADCRSGNLEVHVTRRSSQKTAIVEFDLDPAAQGAGCYVV